MDKELLDAFSVLSTKLRGFKEYFNKLGAEVEILEHKKKSLDKEIKEREEKIVELDRERSDLQFLLDAKKKEDEIKTLAIKQAAEEAERRLKIVEGREKNCDNRELRLKDRERMRGIGGTS